MRRSSLLLAIPLAAIFAVGCDSATDSSSTTKPDDASTEAPKTTPTAGGNKTKGKVKKKPLTEDAVLKPPKTRGDL
jgi:hypothetical protein